MDQLNSTKNSIISICRRLKPFLIGVFYVASSWLVQCIVLTEMHCTMIVNLLFLCRPNVFSRTVFLYLVGRCLLLWWDGCSRKDCRECLRYLKTNGHWKMVFQLMQDQAMVIGKLANKSLELKKSIIIHDLLMYDNGKTNFWV